MTGQAPRPGNFALPRSGIEGAFAGLRQIPTRYHKVAAFDPKSENLKGELRAIATGHFFRMNLRTHHMSCLDMANPEDGKKKAHYMTVIKRSSADQLRNSAPVGRKVMLVWDKACIDYHHWHELPQGHPADPALHPVGARLD